MKIILKQIHAIARLTFFDLIRQKILWSAVMFSVFCLLLAYAAGQLSFVDNARIALDFGLTAISLIGGAIAIVMGGSLVAKEVENRTVYLILTKSLWRWQFVCGKVLGLVSVLAVNTLVMLLILIAVFLLSGGTWNAMILKSFILQLAEFLVLASVACVFSVFSTPLLSGIFTFGFWVIGHAFADIKIFILKLDESVIKHVFQWLSTVLPDLSRFDIKVQVSHQIFVSWSEIGINTFYGLMYAVFALTLSCVIFTSRDL